MMPHQMSEKDIRRSNVIHVTYVTIIWSYERTARIYILLMDLSANGIVVESTGYKRKKSY